MDLHASLYRPIQVCTRPIYRPVYRPIQTLPLLILGYMSIYIKKLHSLYKLCKGDFVVGDIKLQRSLLQNSNFTITHCPKNIIIILSVGFF